MQLKERLRAAGLPVSGVQAVLLQRLLETMTYRIFYEDLRNIVTLQKIDRRIFIFNIMYALLLRHFNYFFRDYYSHANRMCSAWNGCIVFKTKNRIDRCTNLVPVGRRHSHDIDLHYGVEPK